MEFSIYVVVLLTRFDLAVSNSVNNYCPVKCTCDVQATEYIVDCSASRFDKFKKRNTSLKIELQQNKGYSDFSNTEKKSFVGTLAGW